MTQVDLSEYQNLLISDDDYYEQNKDSIETIYSNLKLLVDPADKLSRKDFSDLIDHNDSDKFIMFSFIVNTC